MEIIKTSDDLNIILNQEVDFQTNAGWEESLVEYEDELLLKVLNPIDNFETVRYIHKPYSGITLNPEDKQTDIWFYFYFIDENNTYDNGLDYNLVGITSQENELMLKQSTESFFRLEFFKTPGILDVSGNTIGYEAPNRINRKLVFAKNLSLPLGERFLYTTLNGYIHLPVFQGSNYKNKENMYFFWFADESVLTETNLSGTTTGNTFFMTAKFYNAKDGNIFDFTNSGLTSNYMLNGFNESNDMYFQVDIDKTDYSYQIFSFNGTKGNRIGTTDAPIKFYEKGSPLSSILLTPTPTPTPTTGAQLTLTPTPTPTITLTPSSSGDNGGSSSGCVTITLSDSYEEINCLGQGPYTNTITRVTGTLDSVADGVVSVRVYGTRSLCYGTTQSEQFDIVITAGQLSGYVDIATRAYVDCGGQEPTCIQEVISIDSYVGLTTNYPICT